MKLVFLGAVLALVFLTANAKSLKNKELLSQLKKEAKLLPLPVEKPINALAENAPSFPEKKFNKAKEDISRKVMKMKRKFEKKREMLIKLLQAKRRRLQQRVQLENLKKRINKIMEKRMKHHKRDRHHKRGREQHKRGKNHHKRGKQHHKRGKQHKRGKKNNNDKNNNDLKRRLLEKLKLQEEKPNKQ